MLLSSSHWKRINYLMILVFLTPILFSSCGKKDKTRITFQPNVAPLAFSFTRKEEGLWSAGTGIATPYGIFMIEQEFDRREDFTYIVFRDRAKGIDQVFKVGSKGYIELHTLGEHKLRLQREENKIVIDDEAITGTITVEIYPDSQAVAKIEFTDGPDVVLFSDKRLKVEYNSLLWSDDALLLDSIQSVTCEKGMNYRMLTFNWKQTIKDKTVPLTVMLLPKGNIEQDILSLQSAFNQVAPHVEFKRTYNRGGVILGLIITIVCFLGLFFSVPLWRRNQRIVNEARKGVGFWSAVTGKWEKVLEKEKKKATRGAILTFFLALGLFFSVLYLTKDLGFVSEVLNGIV